jgi:hypothetical protein
MAGPVLTIELSEPVPGEVLGELRALLTGVSSSLSEKRAGDFNASVHAGRLGITDTGGHDGRRPFLITLMGPGVGDEAIFEAEHDYEDPLPLIGFTPTHAINVCAMCNRPVDHSATALLTAALMDLTGGVVMAELREDQFSVVSGLPGVLATTFDRWPTAYGSAQFLRSWARQPGFRLMK